MPFGLELLVERPQRFDLHRVADPLENPFLRALRETVTSFAREHRAERREVQREPRVALLAEVLDRVDHDQLGETVRVIAAFGTTHEVE